MGSFNIASLLFTLLLLLLLLLLLGRCPVVALNERWTQRRHVITRRASYSSGEQLFETNLKMHVLTS